MLAKILVLWDEERGSCEGFILRRRRPLFPDVSSIPLHHNRYSLCRLAGTFGIGGLVEYCDAYLDNVDQ